MAERVEHTYQLKRGLAENWKDKNPVLLEGEPGFETDTYKLKLGDGFTPYNLLPYVNASSILVIEELPLAGIPNTLYINQNDDYSIWIWNNEQFIPLSSGTQEAMTQIPRDNAISVNDYGHEDNSVPYLYGVYGDKNDNYIEKQGLIKGSTGKLISEMTEKETDPDKKSLLEKGILPDHSYADIHTIAIRDGNASIPVGINAGGPNWEFDEETGTFIGDENKVLWYGPAVPAGLMWDIHGRSLRYAQYQRDVAVKEALKEANIDNLHNGEGEGSLQQESCNTIGNYNIATGNETQAGVKGFKVTSTEVHIDPEYPELNYATVYITHNLQFPEKAETVLLIGDETCHFDLNQHWYNKYHLGGGHNHYSGLNKDGTGTLYLYASYPNEYPITEKAFQLGSDDTDNWLWVENNYFSYVSLDKNGDDITIGINPIDWKPSDYDFGATPINQYISGFATGHKSYAAGYGAFAAGRETKAIGNYSTALGRQTMADYASMAIGLKTHALGQQSFAQGSSTKAIGSCAVAEGNGTQALGNYSHAGGASSEAHGVQSFAIGSNTRTYGTAAFSMGNSTHAYGNNSFTGGWNTKAYGENSFAFGAGSQTGTDATTGDGIGAFAIGTGCKAKGTYSFAGGGSSEATAYYSFAFGQNNIAKNTAAAAFGQGTIASNVGQLVAGTYNKDIYTALFAIGNGTDKDNPNNAFTVYKDGRAEIQTVGNTDNSIITRKYANDLIAKLSIKTINSENGAMYQESEKDDTGVTLSFSDVKDLEAKASYSKKYNRTTETGINATSLGSSIALAKRSFAAGSSNLVTATADKAFATGCDNILNGKQAFISGYANYVGTDSSAAFGEQNIVRGDCSFALGLLCSANGTYSTVFGNSNIAEYSNQFVIGKFNQNNYNNIFEVGNGADANNRSNAFAVGRIWDDDIGDFTETYLELGGTTLTSTKLTALVNLDTSNIATKSDVSAPKESIKLIDATTSKIYSISISEGKLIAEEVVE